MGQDAGQFRATPSKLTTILIVARRFTRKEFKKMQTAQATQGCQILDSRPPGNSPMESMAAPSAPRRIGGRKVDPPVAMTDHAAGGSLTPAQAADFLQVDQKTLRKLSAPTGPIPCGRLGKIVRYSSACLERWLASGVSAGLVGDDGRGLQPASAQDAHQSAKEQDR